jgi:hypothetical protein
VATARWFRRTVIAVGLHNPHRRRKARRISGVAGERAVCRRGHDLAGRRRADVEEHQDLLRAWAGGGAQKLVGLLDASMMHAITVTSIAHQPIHSPQP